MNLQGAKILVTGGSSGIGRSTAEELVKAGAKVVITGRDENKLEKIANTIGAIAVHFDVSDYINMVSNCQKVTDALQGIDVLINNAGIGEFPTLEDLKIEHFEKVYATNVFGLTLLTQEIVKHFKKQNSGHIINVASTASLRGFARGSVYSSSKFALRGLSECWRAELRQHNIRVILVNPSEVTTAFNNTERIEREAEDSKLRPEEIAHTIKATLEMDDRGFIPEVSVWATNPK